MEMAAVELAAATNNGFEHALADSSNAALEKSLLQEDLITVGFVVGNAVHALAQRGQLQIHTPSRTALVA